MDSIRAKRRSNAKGNHTTNIFHFQQSRLNFRIERFSVQSFYSIALFLNWSYNSRLLVIEGQSTIYDYNEL